MISRLSLLTQAWRHLGPGWLLFRAGHACATRLGWLRARLPATSWDEQPLSRFLSHSALAEPHAYLEYRRQSAPRFLFRSADRAAYAPLFARWDDGESDVQALAEGIARGEVRYFEHHTVSVGFPPNWHRNPFTGETAPAARHWSEIGDFDQGDIKVIWDRSRFGFVYPLVRAYWRTGNDRHAETFWQLVESWREANPPQQGPNWMCGQEISLRVMAWCFGLWGFLDSPATTPARTAGLAQMIAISGARIEANLAYALSQKNNHGISEGMGLWTIGLLFPELRRSAKWRAIGRRVLERLGRELIYGDGAFSQHSTNYHRLMLHDYLWALRLGDLNQQPLSAELRERVDRAAAFLHQLQDADSGQTPCLGGDDGALILPLSRCDYRDYRPVTQAAWFLDHGDRCHPDGPWDEDLLWLFGPEALETRVTPPERRDLKADRGGYYTVRSPAGFALARCATFRHRPAHADQLHVDVWWRGRNVALDAGTYSYNAPPPWDGALANAAWHNTVTVDDRDQMERPSRFLWLPWSRGKSDGVRRSQSGQIACWEGEHDGYERLTPPVCHRRALVRLGDEHWVVVDRLSSRDEHRYRLHWLLADAPYEWNEASGRLVLDLAGVPYQVQVGTLSGTLACSLVRADEHSPRGWWSPYYLAREPALSLDLTAPGDVLTAWTVLGPAPYSVETTPSAIRVCTVGWEGVVDLTVGDPAGHLVQSASLSGDEDRLEPRSPGQSRGQD